jgi:hypothetical protein
MVRRCASAILGVALLGSPAAAHATGMSGHTYMAECAAEQADPRLTAIVDGSHLRLLNGGFFPDSGYATDDHDQGEIPHWEQFVEAYIQLIRSRWASPLDEPEAALHIAMLLGLAGHGITDSTFDTLFYPRGATGEGDHDDFDLAMDVFLIHDSDRYIVPELDYDAQALSEVFAAIPHDVTAAEIDHAMGLAHGGIKLEVEVVADAADDLGTKYPWARAHLLDPRTAGGYPFGAGVVRRYHEEIARRLEGDDSADGVLIGWYPSAEVPLATLDATRADGHVVLFFGEGIDRASIGPGTVRVLDPSDVELPVDLSVFRGDEWANVIVATPLADWQPSSAYRIVVASSIVTLHGQSPSADFEIELTTCATAAGGDCPEPAGERPPSNCPETDALYPESVPVEEPPTAPPPTTEEGGCAIAHRSGGHIPLSLFLIVVPFLRRRR